MGLFSFSGTWKATVEWRRAATVRSPCPAVRGGLGIVCGIALFYRKVLPVNATTVALTFLLAILAVSTIWGIAVSVLMSVAAMLAFNYYFLPPVGTFTIADPQNWVALFAFLAVSVLASQLSIARQHEAEDARLAAAKSSDCTRSATHLLDSGNVIQLLNRIPTHIVETFEVGAAALYLADKQKFYHSGPVIRCYERKAEASHGCARNRDRRRPQRLLRSRASWACDRSAAWAFPARLLSRQTLEAMGTLIAVAMERARAIEELGQDGSLARRRTAAIGAARCGDPRFPHAAHFDQGLGDQSAIDIPDYKRSAKPRAADRHQRGVRPPKPTGGERRGNGAPRRRRIRARSWNRDDDSRNRRRGAPALQRHPGRQAPLDLAIPPRPAAVRVDFSRIKDVLVRLIENANGYSPADQPITITAEVTGDFIPSASPIADRASTSWK